MFKLIHRVHYSPALPKQRPLLLKTFYTSPLLRGPKPLPPRPVISDDDITESFLKGSGPGGQKINKTSSAVQLKHLASGIVIKCQETRSRSQNRKIARRILAERIEDLEKGDQSRTALKGAEKAKKKASADKKRRRKYRKLAEGEEAKEEVEEEEDEDGGGEEDRDVKGVVREDKVEEKKASNGDAADSKAEKT